LTYIAICYEKPLMQCSSSSSKATDSAR